MAKEKKDLTKPKYKATNPEVFKTSYSDIVPCYEELSSGESVELDAKNKHVINWLSNKIIVKE